MTTDPSAAPGVATVVGPEQLAVTVADSVREGHRFAALFGTPAPDGTFELRAAVVGGGRVASVAARLDAGSWAYPALTRLVPAAAWYERELHDRYGVDPVGHPRLDPLVLPLAADHPRPCGPGQDPRRPVTPDARALDAHASGEGMFTIPYGPVRSGVVETVEYLVETFGEDIPRVRSRVYHKHRAIDLRFEALAVGDGVWLAERVEGTVSVAHAVAYCQALETLAAVEVPRGAALVRVVHAELERIVNHLESVIRHTEGSYQAVAYARMTVQKERLMRLRARLCGHRFGRDVVVPGGVRGPLRQDPSAVRAELDRVARAVAADAKVLMATPSFLDRLRSAGVLPGQLVAEHGALGPVGRGSGFSDDTRSTRPYGAYASLGFVPAPAHEEGDALARQRVRLAEIDESFRLVGAALDELAGGVEPGWRVALKPDDGSVVTAVEAPQGELLYLVEVDGGRLRRVKPRCAAFHNFALFPQAFRGDILTDFVFIEASFGLSIAGVAG